ncbi:putative Immunity protein 75 [Burkholderia cenocepacia]|nr:putative Immunity protein 75 [Burkholderia cenocepacia]
MREQQIELLWQTCVPLTHEQVSQDLAASFMGDVRALVALKRELLPGVSTFVDSVRLEAIDDKADRLVVTTSGGEETRLVHFNPDFKGTPWFGRRLYRLRDWTDNLADWVNRLRREGQLVGKVKREAAAIGGMMRVELTGCREVSTRFHSIQTAPSARRVTAEWVNLADEIDVEISKVLATLG